jgi:hypothetical protein
MTSSMTISHQSQNPLPYCNLNMLQSHQGHGPAEVNTLSAEAGAEGGVVGEARTKATGKLKWKAAAINLSRKKLDRHREWTGRQPEIERQLEGLQR